MAIHGNILDAPEIYIVHQCNCVTNTSKGLSKQIFERYPYANVYKPDNKHNRNIGTIEVRQGEKNIVAFYAQIYPGKARPNSQDDSIHREQYFQQCLDLLSAQLSPGDSIAFPRYIGCGLAGGNIDRYHAMLTNFIEAHSGNTINLYYI